MVHPNVVACDVIGGIAAGLGDGQVHFGRDALRKAFGQASLGPLPSGPLGAKIDALLQSGEREIQQHSECQLVPEEVVDHVG